MKIENDKLVGDSIEFQDSSKHSGNFSQDLPDTIIIHYTAGGSANSAINTLSNPNVKASAHIIIDWDGSITQLIPFNKIAWHAGRSSWNGRTGLNKFSIGIEIVNPGHLKKVGQQYQSWFGKFYLEEEVISATHRNESKERYWHIYKEEQITAVKEVCELLTEEYGIKEILGHEEIAPRRKTDPGPAFPLDKLRGTIFNDRKEINTNLTELTNGIVSVDELNIRENPTVTSKKVNSPLPQGVKVEILDKNGDWLFVSTIIKGWVHSNYINKV